MFDHKHEDPRLAQLVARGSLRSQTLLAELDDRRTTDDTLCGSGLVGGRFSTAARRASSSDALGRSSRDVPAQATGCQRSGVGWMTS